MTKIILSGAFGRMGRAVTAAAIERGDIAIAAGIDPVGGAAEFSLYAGPEAIPAECAADAIIDFSHHTALPELLAFAIARNLPIVVATTGHDEQELAAMHAAAKKIPVFYSRNMSLGINLLIDLCRRASLALGTGFDVEIIERHHNRKLDAPSGTALMLADAIAETREETEYVYDRHTVRRQRDPSEIGIHAVRGGTIVGEHEVMFAGRDEVITLSHSAASREVFATGALAAAHWLPGKPAGLYAMQDLIKEL
ncbi:MAG: 4-hydroxy-tetrahydrodipicolinate reductase [Clostridia bacterium]|nr:4-hydroxy-tetrahydrodipicolinate reductase [Clostridia bacterium]